MYLVSMPTIVKKYAPLYIGICEYKLVPLGKADSGFYQRLVYLFE